MSIVKKVFAAVGLGAASVETELPQSQFMPGESITAVVTITGGDVAQTIEDVYLHVVALCPYMEDGNRKRRQITVATHPLAEGGTIQPGEVRTLTKTFQLACETPLTMQGNTVYIKTGLDVPTALDPTDKDLIEVVPGAIVQGIFDVMKKLGFQLNSANAEEGYPLYPLPYVQVFEFWPRHEPLRSQLDEVEFICLPGADESGTDGAGAETVRIFMQVDRRSRSLSDVFADALDLDESKLEFTLNLDDLPTLEEKLSDIIHAHAL